MCSIDIWDVGDRKENTIEFVLHLNFKIDVTKTNIGEVNEAIRKAIKPFEV